ncbi:Uncharacterised protein family UPF0642 [Phaffia rhodozyma]|uniref:Uncharacterized protein family UPF0642 n=1 Tax=Phaffia rhodozyma TaxID=264483 RepID=A0A0F7STY3_PHARH|nr:Uncharacterised protein family UPF0642 [Phaffia rhodozyma]
MAKSLRSKAKRSSRRLKREEGTYAVHDAARLQRLNARLLDSNSNKDKIGKETEDKDEEDVVGDDEDKDGEEDDAKMSPTPSTTGEAKVSTSGARGSRRENWRESKGMKPRATSHGMNGKGKFVGKRKAGRPARRR